MIHYNAACVCALLGEADRGIDCLEQSIAAGMRHKEWLEHDPDLDSLRGHPRFAGLAGRLAED